MVTPLNPLLAQSLGKGQASHAYILVGSEAEVQAQAMAMALNCLAPVENEACGDCLSCCKISHHNHPNVTEIAPDRNFLRIEQMRKLQSEAYYEKYEGRYKIFIIKDSEAMKLEAANSLLKLLEEPPADTVFLLLAAGIEKILPTILSRCQLISLGGTESVALSEAMVEQELAGAEEFLRALGGKQLYQVLSMTNALEKDRERALHFIAACLRIVHSALAANFISADANCLPVQPKYLLKAAKDLDEAMDLVKRNINLKLLLDVLFLKLWSVFKQPA